MNRITALCLAAACLVGVVAPGYSAGEQKVSKVLGPLPTPQELANAHEKLQPPPRGDLPAEMTIDAATAKGFDRLYRHVTFKDDQLYGGYGSKSIPLGVTGIHANEYTDRHELFVVEIEAGSPADDRVRPGDIILGANGRLFEQVTAFADPRVPMGYALAESQTEQLGGVLTLQLVRDGKFLNVPVKIGVEGAYSSTWPFDCKKSDGMADRMVEMILRRYTARPTFDSRHGGGSWWHPLILLGAGEDAAMERARRCIYGEAGLADDAWPKAKAIVESGRYPLPEKITGSSWALGYELTTLCEYYLLTGDSAVLPRIMDKKHRLEQGQAPSGSWCHGMGFGGYGELNAAGGPCFVGLALAKECGMPMDPIALKRSANFWRQFSGGAVPYGNHSPGPMGSSDNGKNGMAAVAFHILGEPETATGLGRPTCYSYLCRENGHADGVLAFAWGPLGAYFAPKAEFHLFMNNLIWYYELGRTREGGMRFLRGCHWSRPYGQSGPMGLFLMIPRQQLRILGGPKTIFGVRPPKALAGAARLYRFKQWQALDKFLNNYLAKHTDGPDADYARQLLAAYRRLESHADATMKLIAASIAKGDAYTAGQQLAGLRTLLGEQRPAMTKVRQYLDSDAGKKALADSTRWQRPGPVSKPVPVFRPGPPAPTCWTVALPTMADKAGDARCLALDGDASEPPAGWYATGFDDGAWKRLDGPIANDSAAPKRYVLRRTFTLADGHYPFVQIATEAGGDVYLNGYRIATLTAAVPKRQQDDNLRAAAAKVLRPGKNVLAAVLSGAPMIDITVRVGPGKADVKALRRGLIKHMPFSDTDRPRLTNGAKLADGKLGRAMQFPGSIMLTDIKQPIADGKLGSLSVAMWVHVPNDRRAGLAIASAVETEPGQKPHGHTWTLGVGNSAGSLRLVAKGAGKIQRTKAARNAPTLNGKFQHFAWVYDAKTKTAMTYRNGVLIESQEMTGDGISAADGPVTATSDSSAMLDELTLWRRTLSADEVVALVRGGYGLSLESR